MIWCSQRCCPDKSPGVIVWYSTFKINASAKLGGVPSRYLSTTTRVSYYTQRGIDAEVSNGRDR